MPDILPPFALQEHPWWLAVPITHAWRTASPKQQHIATHDDATVKIPKTNPKSGPCCFQRRPQQPCVAALGHQEATLSMPQDLTQCYCVIQVAVFLRNTLHHNEHITTATHQWFCVDPVSWLSTKVTALLGHHPIRPGGLPAPSFMRQYCTCFTASCKMPLVGKSKAQLVFLAPLIPASSTSTSAGRTQARQGEWRAGVGHTSHIPTTGQRIWAWVDARRHMRIHADVGHASQVSECAGLGIAVTAQGHHPQLHIF